MSLDVLKQKKKKKKKTHGEVFKFDYNMFNVIYNMFSDSNVFKSI